MIYVEFAFDDDILDHFVVILLAVVELDDFKVEYGLFMQLFEQKHKGHTRWKI